MSGPAMMHFSPVMLRPDPGRTVVRPFEPGDPEGYATPGHSRTERIANRVLAMESDELHAEFARVAGALDERHRNVEQSLRRRFDELDLGGIDKGAIGHDRALLIAAYFCEEYSFEAAALFNPSIVRHPDQGDVPDGALRFILSLRGIGEGHVSSVTFRTGTWAGDGDITVDPPCPTGVPPTIEKGEGDEPPIRLATREVADLSELVLFPMTPGQKQGIEDLRLTCFHTDAGEQRYVGTFTAFSGTEVRTELLATDDFRSFRLYPLEGAVAGSKGMAAFPRKVGGRFAMLGRQDNESVWVMFSDDYRRWDAGTKVISPRFPWEFVQMGNCGAPIELDEGWLVLTHGVGTVRNYCMGASLLDKEDPTKLLARTPMPIIEPDDKDRDGYVPNVVYSCGALLRERELLIPYGVADNFATFATVKVDDLLAAMV